MATTDTLVLESNKSSYMGWSERKNALKSGGAQRLNRVVLYGKNLISMEKLQNLGALPPPPHPPGSCAYGMEYPIPYRAMKVSCSLAWENCNMHISPGQGLCWL